MSKQITIKDSLYEKLSGVKGESSFSNAIESFVKKAEACPHNPEAQPEEDKVEDE